MRAGVNVRKGDGKTLAERLAETRQASSKVMDLAEDPAEEIAEVEEAGTPQPVDETSGSETDAIIQAAKAARPPVAAVPAKGKMCLIVDDSRVVRKLASKIVTELGYQAVEAENGEEALARCNKQMPALVITDWNMPVMTGIDFVMTLRSMPADKAPIVVFCTSKGEAQDIHAGISAGADDYIVKPFTEEALTAKLEKLGVA
ncbi:response regulator [Aurantiacibacter hainanensis]|uniref:response regulator n=1 Tax=Aurantiacibacter hainanensis TaxID=3076114 RepID=UPI0030C67423